MGGIGGFTLSSGGLTANGTLTVSNLTVDGTIAGSSQYIIPNPSGNIGKFLNNNGSSLSWGDLSSQSGVRSMQVWTSMALE